jgi:hypothetical protein
MNYDSLMLFSHGAVYFFYYRNQYIYNKDWGQIGGWRDSGWSHYFNMGSGLDLSTGVYTAPVTGVYFMSLNVRLDSAYAASTSDYFVAGIARNVAPGDSDSEIETGVTQGGMCLVTSC